MNDIILKEDGNKKLSEKGEPLEYDDTNIENYEKELYKIDKLSPDDSHKIVT